MKNVVVVGAGVAGLSAAIRLQAAGCTVHVFEKEALPGGKMHVLRKDGYQFDVGPTLVMMPELYKEVFRAAGKNPDDYIPMDRLDPMYSVFFPHENYKRYTVSNDLTELTRQLERISDRDAQGFFRYIENIYQRYLIARDNFITRPFLKPSDFYNISTLRKAFKLKTFDSAERSIARFVRDRRIQQMLSFQTLYIGVSPKNGPSLYTIIPMIELLYGVWFLRGGMSSMAQGMARAFEELGGRITYNTQVERILIRDGKACGVYAGGQELSADYVLSAADFPYAMTSLIDDKKAKGRYTDARIRDMKYSCSCFVLYLGMKKKYSELDVHNFIIARDLDKNLANIFNGTRLSETSVYLHIPSRADPSLAPENMDAFYVLTPVSELSTARYTWDDATIQHYTTMVLNELARLPGLANIKNEIAVQMYMTPEDFQRKFNAYNGACFGLQPTLNQSNHLRPQCNAARCSHLYFAGSSNHPGAGVPIAMESGKIAAEEIIRALR